MPKQGQSVHGSEVIDRKRKERYINKHDKNVENPTQVNRQNNDESAIHHKTII